MFMSLIYDSTAHMFVQIHTVPSFETELLKDIGQKFATVGMCEQACKALVMAEDIKGAIAVCIKLNQWDLAMKLAKTHRVPEV